MPTRDLHSQPFDPGTLVKLELFKLTAEGFLAVFIGSNQQHCKNIKIFDFFCGPGMDSSGQEGSPPIILRQLQTLSGAIRANHYVVDVYLNDSDAEKILELKRHLDALGLSSGPYEIHYSQRRFLDVFPSAAESFSNSANLVLVDQNGVKEFPRAVFERLRRQPMTDVLVFMSSSYAWRFQDEPEIQRHLETEKAFMPDTPFHETHRAMVNYYRSSVQPGETYYLAPFSIKKVSNVYGVMFGSSNLKGLEKFLEAAWRIDGKQGDSNFDIDQEGRFSLPGEMALDWGKTKKVTVFERELSHGILTGALTTTAEIYLFTLERGFLTKHANTVLRELWNSRRIAKVTGLGYLSIANPVRVVLLQH